ncbi:MAG: class F sortase [Dehalococcoidia bacterium]
MKNFLPRITEITRRRILTGVAVVAFSAAVMSFVYVGMQLAGSESSFVGGGPTSTKYASVWNGAARYLVEPGGVYDRVDQPSWLYSPYNYSVSNVIDDGSVGPLERRSFRILIDEIEVNAPVKSYGMNSEYVPDVPLSGQEVAWYTFSSPPGTGGNAVFAAHYTWAGGAVFNKLKDLKPGDSVYLQDARGTELTYVVTSSFIIDPEDKASLQWMGPASEDIITLITCAGRYRSTGDPLLGGEYNHRRVVRAKLMNIYAPPGHPWNPLG